MHYVIYLIVTTAVAVLASFVPDSMPWLPYVYGVVVLAGLIYLSKWRSAPTAAISKQARDDLLALPKKKRDPDVPSRVIELATHALTNARKRVDTPQMRKARRSSLIVATSVAASTIAFLLLVVTGFSVLVSSYQPEVPVAASSIPGSWDDSYSVPSQRWLPPSPSAPSYIAAEDGTRLDVFRLEHISGASTVTVARSYELLNGTRSDVVPHEPAQPGELVAISIGLMLATVISLCIPFGRPLLYDSLRARFARRWKRNDAAAALEAARRHELAHPKSPALVRFPLWRVLPAVACFAAIAAVVTFSVTHPPKDTFETEEASWNQVAEDYDLASGTELYARDGWGSFRYDGCPIGLPDCHSLEVVTEDGKVLTVYVVKRVDETLIYTDVPPETRGDVTVVG